MVTIKVSNQGVSPILAAAIRSVVASLLLWLYALAIRERVFLQKGFFKHGVAIGLLFGIEFLFLFWGLKFTHASRAVIFLYTQPLWTVVLAHLKKRGSDHFLGGPLSGFWVTIRKAGSVLLGRRPHGDRSRLSMGCHHHIHKEVHLEYADYALPDAFCSAFLLHSCTDPGFTPIRVGIAGFADRPCDCSPILPIGHSGLRQLLRLVLATPPVPGRPLSRVHFPDPNLWRHSQRNFSSRAAHDFPMDRSNHGYQRDIPCE
jgi:hypothetical protein